MATHKVTSLCGHNHTTSHHLHHTQAIHTCLNINIHTCNNTRLTPCLTLHTKLHLLLHKKADLQTHHPNSLPSNLKNRLHLSNLNSRRTPTPCSASLNHHHLLPPNPPEHQTKWEGSRIMLAMSMPTLIKNHHGAKITMDPKSPKSSLTNWLQRMTSTTTNIGELTTGETHLNQCHASSYCACSSPMGNARRVPCASTLTSTRTPTFHTTFPATNNTTLHLSSWTTFNSPQTTGKNNITWETPRLRRLRTTSLKLSTTRIQHQNTTRTHHQSPKNPSHHLPPKSLHQNLTSPLHLLTHYHPNQPTNNFPIMHSLLDPTEWIDPQANHYPSPDSHLLATCFSTHQCPAHSIFTLTLTTTPKTLLTLTSQVHLLTGFTTHHTFPSF